MLKIFALFVLIDLFLTLFFHTFKAFLSIQLGLFFSIFIPFLTYLNIKSKLSRFCLAPTSRIIIKHIVPLEKLSLIDKLKYSKAFINIQKIFIYLIFSFLVVALINAKLFDIFAFFASSIAMLIFIVFVWFKKC